MGDRNLERSLALLDAALAAHEQEPSDELRFAALSKAFEVAFEYAWKGFKRDADEAGLEVYSPRDSIKAAARLGTIDSPERWNDFLNARNLSVHDYVGLDDERFLVIVRDFAAAARQLLG